MTGKQYKLQKKKKSAYIYVEMYCPKAFLLLHGSLIIKNILILCLVLSGSGRE